MDHYFLDIQKVDLYIAHKLQNKKKFSAEVKREKNHTLNSTKAVSFIRTLA